jgi:hypothetical protein
MDEVIKMIANRRVRTLQKGSVKGFVKDNNQISGLDAMSKKEIDEIEKTLQIRHLYAHRNGIVDEGFLLYFRGQYPSGTEHKLSMDEVFDKYTFLASIIDKIDRAAIGKYELSTTEP